MQNKHATAIVIILIFFSNFLLANQDLRLQPVPYTIVKDVEDKNIDTGWFILSGMVKGFSSNLPIDDVLVGSLSSGLWVRSDEKGEFEIKLKSNDRVVYFYKENWSEVVIEDYVFKDQHRIEMNVYLSQEQIPQTVRKPVIYMYNDEDLSTTILLRPNGEFTFSYPLYDNGWKATVKAEGGVEVNGKHYPYLFWEAESYQIAYQKKQHQLPGFLFATDSMVEFFEEKLSALGLNYQEQTDFITYWGPLLSVKKYAFVQFLIDDAYNNNIAALDITPVPNSIRRVYIICSPLDKPEMGMEIVPQELNGFERNGLTVVEWGGSLLNMQNLNP